VRGAQGAVRRARSALDRAPRVAARAPRLGRGASARVRSSARSAFRSLPDADREREVRADRGAPPGSGRRGFRKLAGV